MPRSFRFIVFQEEGECKESKRDVLERWGERNHNQLQRLLRASGLYREKMDRIDYIGNTITKSLDMVREQYDPKSQMRTRWLKRRIAMGRGNSG